MSLRRTVIPARNSSPSTQAPSTPLRAVALLLRPARASSLVDLIHDIKQAKEAGAADAVLESPRDFQRKASFYIDFVMSENSMGFHADGECLRVLGNAIDFCRKGQLALRTGAVAKMAAGSAK